MYHRITLLSILVCLSHLFSAGAAQARPRSTLRSHRHRRRVCFNFFRPAPSPGQVDDMVSLAAISFEIDPQLVCAIIKVESAYNTNAVSRVGARGLMQLMPATARRFGISTPGLFNPANNISAGTAYLKQLLHLFSGNIPLAVAAYNAGENAVIKAGGIPPYPETQDYVRKVSSLYSLGVIDPITPVPIAG